jgi:ribose transport system ATP-binding protein
LVSTYDGEVLAMNTAMSGERLLEVQDLHKSFGRNHALRGVDLAVRAGELHALLGANGAGKSTLIKILDGLERPDSGVIEVEGQPLRTAGHRIGVIHQNLGLIDTLTVQENLLLSHPRTRGPGLLKARAERTAARAALDRIELDLDLDAPLSDLGLGQKSLVAVARLLDAEARILILDEVTAALTRKESDFVLEQLKKVAGAGAGVLVVTHRLHEVAHHCDWVTLLDEGLVGYSAATPTLEEIQRLFVGRASEAAPAARRAGHSAPPLVSLDRCSTRLAGPVDLEVRGGEVVGLIGTLSSNLYEIGHMITGSGAVIGGHCRVGKRDGAPGSGRVSFVPEERRAQGLVSLHDVRSNICIGSLPMLSRSGWVNTRREAAAGERMVGELNVQPAETSLPIEALSGGNQQKVLMARAALRDSDVYVLCEPTLGVDLTTRRAIYEFIRKVRDAGAAVVIITIDPEDALAVSDRIGVVEAGRITSMRPAHDMTMLDVLEAVS